ncbi:MAG: hypothetical protein JWQ09_1493 [Segetibacter sp.]|nr:hypothetical protein [Segetibacter sp.]
MFTEYTKEEIENPGMQLKAEGQKSENFNTAKTISEQDTNLEVKDTLETNEFYNNDQLPYNMEGESLW